jgi:Secretion system C-terminal sorting domain
MKRSLVLTFLLLLLTFGIANAVNTIELTPIPFQPSGATNVVVSFNWVNDVLLQGVSNGYMITVTGPATADWVNGSHTIAAGHDFDIGWNVVAGGAGDLLMGGAYLPPVLNGVPAGSTVGMVVIDMALGFTGNPSTDTADICIDTAFIPPAGGWLWDAGQPTGNVHPVFNSLAVYCFGIGYIPCQPPAFTTIPAGDVVSGDHCVGADFQFAADPVEPGKVITGYAVTSGPGTITAGGFYEAGAAAPGTSAVEVTVSNDCPGTSAPYAFTLNLTNSGLAYTTCPVGVKQVSQGKDFAWDLGLDNYDCDPIIETIVPSGAPTNTPTVVGGLFSWTTDGADVGMWTFTVTGDDQFGETAVCVIEVEVTATSTWGVRIAKIGDDSFVFQGHYATLPIYLDYMGTEDGMGGFDFLIAYDASALTFIGAERGDAISCWEYFTYRFGPFGNCGGMCPSGMLRLIGMAEANDGPHHPEGCDGDDGFFVTPDAELAKIKFFVTNDRTYECQYVPVYFFWMDCGDNAISDWEGEDLYISNHVYNINWVDINNAYYELIPSDGSIDENDFIYGAPWYCDTLVLGPDQEPKPAPIRDVDFFNGGVDIACADEIDLRGDINLNNLANEIADAVLYTNYFIYGPVVFTVNYEGQVAASDVNNDGRVLTVGDLVYLIRILTNDAVPYAKLSPFASEATIRVSNGTVSLNSGVNVGAALFVFDGEAEVSNLTGMDILADVVDGQTRVLVYNIGEGSIDAGLTDVLTVTGDATLTEVEVSDYYGNMVNTNVVAKVVPKAYALMQNFPNPFNPTTEVAFDLPEAANWTINIYNVAGQMVKSFSGYSDAGTVKVNVDAAGWASGIYFYKATANDFVSTKKMVLMK